MAKLLGGKTLNPLTHSITEVREVETLIRNQAIRFVLKNILNRRMRSARHFREWFKTPMSYARIMELPLTALFLQAETNDRILDVSSPKLLALYYSLRGHKHTTTSDLKDYFVSDFEAFEACSGLKVETAVFDAAEEIPYQDQHFDKVFSVSVVEHIPQDGDMLAVREMLRVMKPSGCLVVTLPVFKNHIEEWISSSDLYWTSAKDEDGRIFYQKRYDENSLRDLVATAGGIIEDYALIAEKPLRPPRTAEDGRMHHNSYYMDEVPIASIIKKVSRLVKVLPFLNYWAEHIVSKKCHYLTTDWKDPNIRQVAVKIGKGPAK